MTPTTASKNASASGRWARSCSFTSSRHAARTATRERPVVLRPDLPRDRWAREVSDRRRVAITANLTPAPPAPWVSDASPAHTACGPLTHRAFGAYRAEPGGSPGQLQRGDVPAVYGVHLAGDPARGVAAQQRHEGGRLTRLPHP